MKIEVKNLSPEASEVVVTTPDLLAKVKDMLVENHYSVGDAGSTDLYSEGAVELVAEELEVSSKRAEKLVDAVYDDVVSEIADRDADAREDAKEYNSAMKGEY